MILIRFPIILIDFHRFSMIFSRPDTFDHLNISILGTTSLGSIFEGCLELKTWRPTLFEVSVGATLALLPGTTLSQIGNLVRLTLFRPEGAQTL